MRFYPLFIFPILLLVSSCSTFQPKHLTQGWKTVDLQVGGDGEMVEYIKSVFANYNLNNFRFEFLDDGTYKVNTPDGDTETGKWQIKKEEQQLLMEGDNEKVEAFQVDI